MNEKILRINDVIKIVRLSRTTIWRLEQEQLFPKRRKIGKRSVGWIESEINLWLNKK